jgi:hypothetical protein
MLLHLELNALVIATNNEDMEEISPLQKQYHELMQLEEHRVQAVITMSKRQQEVKRHFDKSTTAIYFQKDQLVLLWNKAKEKPYFHTKFEALWIGPYQIEKVIGFNSYLLKDMKGIFQAFPVNGKYLKHFFV